MSPPVVCIVGKSKRYRAGLMVELIKELKNRGQRVGAIKHHRHGDFEIDVQGKDTWKYTKAGADTVAISSSIKLAVIKNVESEIEIDEILDKFFKDNDIVLADGFALSDKPRIIIADAEEDIALFKKGCRVVAVVGRAGLDMDNVAEIADKVLSFSGSLN